VEKCHQQVISELQKTGCFMMNHSLAWGTAGNISAMINDTDYYITASGSYLGELSKEDLVLCPKPTQVVKRPSKEAPMHEAIYNERPDIKAILHASPFYSTLLASSSLSIPSNYFVESMYYLEKIERVRYEHPGSSELANAVKEKAQLANVLLLENHGVVVYDVSLKEALTCLQTLEFAAKMTVTSLNQNIKINGLSKEIEEDFLDNSGYKKRRKWKK
jgi:3-dehydro-4-phosphotetronate decarboxylase